MKIGIAVASSLIALVCTLLLSWYLFANRTEEPSAAYEATVTQESSEEAFTFEVVGSPAARAKGLSGRADVPAGYGMLFVFDVPDRYGFWMKDMLVSIDIIWLSSDGTILGIEEAVSPATYPEPFYPPVPVRLVLETRAGEARAQGWAVGTQIELPL